VEWLLETVTANGHHFCTHGNTDVDVAGCNLVGNILCGLETRGAETIDGGGCGSVRETGSESCGTEFVGGFAIGDLQIAVSD
jgi:hypothetical protein